MSDNTGASEEYEEQHFPPACQGCIARAQERDSALADVARLTRERDEARRERDMAQSNSEDRERMRRERDEALAKADNFEEVHNQLADRIDALAKEGPIIDRRLTAAELDEMRRRCSMSRGAERETLRDVRAEILSRRTPPSAPLRKLLAYDAPGPGDPCDCVWDQVPLRGPSPGCQRCGGTGTVSAPRDPSASGGTVGEDDEASGEPGGGAA